MSKLPIRGLYRDYSILIKGLLGFIKRVDHSSFQPGSPVWPLSFMVAISVRDLGVYRDFVKQISLTEFRCFLQLLRQTSSCNRAFAAQIRSTS